MGAEVDQGLGALELMTDVVEMIPVHTEGRIVLSSHSESLGVSNRPGRFSPLLSCKKSP